MRWLQEVDTAYMYTDTLKLQNSCRQVPGLQKIRLIPLCAVVLLYINLTLPFEKNSKQITCGTHERT